MTLSFEVERKPEEKSLKLRQTPFLRPTAV